MKGRFYIETIETELPENNAFLIQFLRDSGAKFEDDETPVLKGFRVKDIDGLIFAIERDWESELKSYKKNDPEYSELDFGYYDNDYNQEVFPLTIDRGLNILDCAVMSLPITLRMLEEQGLIEHKTCTYKTGERRKYKICNEKYPVVIDLY